MHLHEAKPNVSQQYAKSTNDLKLKATEFNVDSSSTALVSNLYNINTKRKITLIDFVA